MALTAGTKLGPYEILAMLGAGGMGEVYRALDTRLDRTVAVKVLASHLSSSPELKQRMEREAKAISSLNHPHICHLYDIGSQDGTDYLVMEFLEGETLAERLRKGAMPLNEVLKIGIAVAEALAVAPRQGIVHRDLKPGNIMLTQGGAKLMDFGLAKPLGLRNTAAGSGAAPSFTAAATLSGPSPLSPLTTAGSIIGTIQYMSPEQIEGKEADARSDIFAFGAVLYEMATGKRAFHGKSHLSTASSILEKDPDPISTIQPLAPKALEHTVQTCLAKDPEERFQSAYDLKLQLLWLTGAGAERPPSDTPADARSPMKVWAASAVAALAVVASVLFWITRDAGNGSVVEIMSITDGAAGATWGTDGYIYLGRFWRGGLSRVAQNGGKSEKVTSPDPARKEQGHRWPEMLPDGNSILFSITKNFGASDAELGVLSIKTRTWHTILSNASNAHYVPTGHLVYAHAGTLMAVPFDLESLSVTGPPVQVVHEVLTNPDDGYGGMSVARSGNLVYVSGPERTDRGASTRLVWVSRE